MTAKFKRIFVLTLMAMFVGNLFSFDLPVVDAAEVKTKTFRSLEGGNINKGDVDYQGHSGVSKKAISYIERVYNGKRSPLISRIKFDENDTIAYCLNWNLDSPKTSGNSYIKSNETLTSKEYTALMFGYGYEKDITKSLNLKDQYERYYVTQVALYVVSDDLDSSQVTLNTIKEYNGSFPIKPSDSKRILDAVKKYVNHVEGNLMKVPSEEKINVKIVGDSSKMTEFDNYFETGALQVDSTNKKAELSVDKKGLNKGYFVDLNGKEVNDNFVLSGNKFKIRLAKQYANDAGNVSFDVNGKVIYQNVSKYIPANGQTGVEGEKLQRIAWIDKDSNSSKDTFNASYEMIKGKIEITKTDVATGDLLPNAKFEIKNAGGKIVRDGKTNSKGIAVFDELPMGEYTYREFEAPTGYVVDETAFPFEVKKNGQIIKAKMTNKMIEGNLKIIKKDHDTGKKLSGAVFEVKDSKDKVVKTITTNKDGIAEVKGLKYGNYTVTEIKAPESYILEENNTKNFSVEKNNETVELQITNKFNPITPLEPAKTKVSVEKKWSLYKEKATPVKVNLLADGKVIDTVTLSKANDWKHVFTDLPVVNAITDKEKIKYTVQEVDVDYEKFEVEVTGNQSKGYVITNTEKVPQTPLEPAKTKVSVEKKWSLYKEKATPVKVNLLADGKVIDTVTLSKANDWKHVFTDLPVVNAITDKEKIKYTVQEVDVDYEKFEVEVTGDQSTGYVITNTEKVPQTPLEPAKTKVSVEKKWSLYKEKATPVKVNLLADGKVIDTVILSHANDWKHVFTDLPVVNAITDKEKIKYTVQEVDVDYEKFEVEVTGDQSTGYVITNTEKVPQTPLEPAKKKVAVEKLWKGEPAEEVVIHLLANGKVVDSIVLSKENDWKHVFTDLPVQYKATDEKTIEYTVAEEPLEGYKTDISGNAKEGFIVTNTRVGEVTIEGTKTWVGDQEENRPNSIIVKLLANGEVIQELEVTKDMNWQFSFSNLEQYDAEGNLIDYTIEEVDVEGYKTLIDGFDIVNEWVPVEEVVEKPETPTKVDKLPQTGNSMNYMFSLLGIVLLMVSGFVFYRTRKLSADNKK